MGKAPVTAKSLKEHRQASYLSTRELAAKAGVGADTIWRIEGGDFKRLQPRTMRQIAAALNLVPSEIREFVPQPVEGAGKAVDP